MNLKKKVSNWLNNLTAFRGKAGKWKIVRRSNAHYKELFAENGTEYRQLTSAQKQEIDHVWKRYCEGSSLFKYNRYSYATHELYYSVTGEFQPMIVPEELWWPTLFNKINIPDMMPAWADKNYFELLLPCGSFPKVVVRNINGCLEDANYQAIDEMKANQLLNSQGDVFVKPALDSGAGMNVHLYKKEDKITIQGINNAFQKNYVVQALFHQHEDMSQLNQSSVNIVRLITVMINGKVELLMSAVRVGNKGAINDYSPTSKGTGTVIIGVDETGAMKPFGFEPCGRRVTCCSNGYVFAGHKIPKFAEMVENALAFHLRMPYFKMIGWDMVVDSEGKTAIMEYNLKWPGILYYQWCNGPLFGTDETRVHQYVNALIS